MPLDAPQLLPPAAGRLLRPFAFASAIALCLALAAIALAALPSPGAEESHSFGQSIRIIGATIYERVILPRPPTAASGYRNWMLSLQAATPLMLAGLAVALAFGAGVLNIGAQGQYIAGAIGTTAVALYLPIPSSPTLIAAHLLAAALCGAAMAAVAGVLDRWRNVPVVLSTLLLNFVALELLRYLLQGPMRARSDAGTWLDPQSPPLPEAAWLPEILASTPGRGIGAGIFLAAFLAIVMALMLRFTTFGFRLRVVGQNKTAARFAGMNVGRVSVAALALSGALAGLAGGVRVAGAPSYILFPDLGADAVGFTAIAVALLGGLGPIGVAFSALFFGLLHTAFRALEMSPLQIHSSTAQAVQGALVLSILIVTSPRWSRRMRKT